jgi:hypothetical protein
MLMTDRASGWREVQTDTGATGWLRATGVCAIRSA